MIVELTDNCCWGLSEKLPGSFENFFKSCGYWEHEERKAEQTKEINGDKCVIEVIKHRYYFKAICEVSEVPIEILNSNNVSIRFYQNGMKVMGEKVNAVNRFHESAQNITIHFPSNELISINDVTWIEDACTEELQRMLNSGFRIISCIPQIGNRRPDYVLGRKKE